MDNVIIAENLSLSYKEFEILPKIFLSLTKSLKPSSPKRHLVSKQGVLSSSQVRAEAVNQPF